MGCRADRRIMAMMQKVNDIARNRQIMPYVMLAPFLIMFIVFFLGPMIAVVGLSLFHWNGISEPIFCGFSNYAKLLRDPRFLTALKNTAWFTIVYNAIMMALSISLALALASGKVFGCRFLRAAYFAPVTMSLAVVALVFDIILARGGLLNLLLSQLGLKSSVAWLWEPRYAMWAMVFMRLWRASGYYATMLISGLQNIPEEVIEAAEVDGATSRQITTHVILPLLKPMILFVLVASTIWSLQLFDEPWILNRGGPSDSTLSLVQLLYQNGFEFFKLGYSAAITVILIALIMVVAVVQMRVFRDEIV